MNYRTVFHTIGKVILFEALFLTLPLIVSFVYGDSGRLAFAVSILTALVIGSIMLTVFRPEFERLSIGDGFVIVALSWICLLLIGSLPFVISGEIPSFTDAFFETVSGFTTTGASILTDVESMSRSLLFWRSFTHWLGGMGVLVFVMAVLNRVPDRYINILKAEIPGHSVEKITARASGTVKIFYCIYSAMTLAEIILLIAFGMPVFDSVVHALGTAGTGGFGIRADSLGSCSSAIQWTITVFMLMFGVNFNIYFLIIIRKWKNIADANELWIYLGIFAVSTAAITANILPVYHSLPDSVRNAAFQVSSLLTTTGYSTADFNLWPGLSKGILFMLMFFGGCMGSTAGGFKIARITVLLQIARNEIRRTLKPRAVCSVRLNGKTLTSVEERGFMSYLIMYAVSLGTVFLLISFEPMGFETTFSSAVACFNNIGPGFALAGPASDFSAYTDWSKIVLSIAMLLGRLEIYPVLALFSPRTWNLS